VPAEAAELPCHASEHRASRDELFPPPVDAEIQSFERAGVEEDHVAGLGQDHVVGCHGAGGVHNPDADGAFEVTAVGDEQPLQRRCSP
jgi:hypothetical protein